MRCSHVTLKRRSRTVAVNSVKHGSKAPLCVGTSAQGIRKYTDSLGYGFPGQESPWLED